MVAAVEDGLSSWLPVWMDGAEVKHGGKVACECEELVMFFFFFLLLNRVVHSQSYTNECSQNVPAVLVVANGAAGAALDGCWRCICVGMEKRGRQQQA